MVAVESAPKPEKLSRLTKFAFGAGDLGPAVVTTIYGFYLSVFLLDVAGLRPEVVAIIFLIVKAWDAVNDPLVGVLSDRTKTRWGRRRPWLLFGAIPVSVQIVVAELVNPQW